MDFLRPATLAHALEARAERPAAAAIAGGTDVMVELNFGTRRPDALLDLNRVAELTEAGTDDGMLRVGACVSYARIIGELGRELPGLAMAARTVGSPQIRNRGTVGGNLGSASPAGDMHPVLLACDALVEAASARGTVLRRPEAQRARAGRADHLVPDRARGLAAAVRQDRHEERDGDRGLLVRAVPLARRPPGWHRAAGPPVRPG